MSWMIKPIMFGGWSPDAKAGMAGDNSRDLRNIRFNEYGGIETIDGCSGYTDTTASGYWINDVFAVNSLSSVSVLHEKLGWVLGTNEARLYSIGAAAFTLLSGFTEIDSTNHETNLNAYYTVLANKVLISTSSGEVNPEIWTGFPSVVLSTQADCPPARYPATHYNRIFLGHSKANPSRLWWSPLYLSGVWTTGTAGNWVDINRDDGDYITGLRSFAGELLIWKNQRLYKMTGDDFDISSGNFSVVESEGVPGAVWNNSIVEAEGALYWYSHSGFIKYQGGAITPIGYGLVDREVTKYLDEGADVKREKLIGAYRSDRKEIWWMVPTGNHIFIYNIALNKWSHGYPPHQITSIYATSLYEASLNINMPVTIYGGILSSAGTKPAFLSACIEPNYVANVKNWNGEVIDSYYCTDFIDLGAKQHKGSPRVIIYPDGANTSDLSASIYFDDYKGNYDPLAAQSMVFNTQEVYMKDWYPQVQAFYRTQIKLAINTLNKKMIINKVEVEFNADTESGRI